MGIYEPGGCSEPGAASQVRTTQGAAAGRRHDGWVRVCVCVFCRVSLLLLASFSAPGWFLCSLLTFQDGAGARLYPLDPWRARAHGIRFHLAALLSTLF